MNIPEAKPPRESLTRRGLGSLRWTTFASLATLPVSFLQTVALARLLPVTDFGLFGGVSALVNVSYPLFEFGLSAAFLHRAPETEDEEHATAVFFTLRLILTSIWAAFLLLFAAAALSGTRQQVLAAVTLSSWALRLAHTGQVVLIRRVLHRRLAVMDMVQTGLVFLLSVGAAAVFHSVWALALAAAVQAVVYWIALAVIRPVWRPRLAWDREARRYFFRFGSRTVAGLSLAVALEYLDDLWTNLRLGDAALGYYSRAFRFATYPRIILADPIAVVTTGVYAELKGDRLRLSQAFFRVNALLARSGFFLAGWLALTAPQLILVVLGEKWLPMLPAFRLMLIYTLGDPVKLTVASVLVASGTPEQTAWARSAQMLTLIAGLLLLGPRYGIVGVALAVDAMLVVGLTMLLTFARRHVDFSALRLFGAPAVALLVGLTFGIAAGSFSRFAIYNLALVVLQTAVYVLGYAITLLVLERRELFEVIRWAAAYLLPARG